MDASYGTMNTAYEMLLDAIYLSLHNITSLITGGVIGKFLRTGVVFNLGSGKATYNERK